MIEYYDIILIKKHKYALRNEREKKYFFFLYIVNIDD